MVRTVSQEQAYELLKVGFKISKGALKGLKGLLTQELQEDTLYSNYRNLLEIMEVKSFTTVQRTLKELSQRGLITFSSDRKGTVVNLARCKHLAQPHLNIVAYLASPPANTTHNPTTSSHTSPLHILHPEQNQQQSPPIPPNTKSIHDTIISLTDEHESEGAISLIIPMSSTPPEDMVEHPIGVWSYL